MREQFESILQDYNEVAKSEDGPEKELKRAEEIGEAITERASTEEAQEAIYGLQERKAAIMAKLTGDLADIDRDGFVPPPKAIDEKNIVEEDGKFYWKNPKDKNKAPRPVTRGELLTDGEWGVKYYLDESVGRRTRKRFVIENAKRELMGLLNTQIMIDESASGLNKDELRGAYARKLEEKGTNEGEVAEKLIKNFLKKISIDYDVDFEVVEADVFLDVNAKVDFIIKRVAHNRGIGVESKEKVAVQFTLSDREDVLRRKQQDIEKSKARLRRIDHIDDLMLVTLPMDAVKPLVERWEKDGKKPGGPDKLMPLELKEHIFKNVMKGIIPDGEIDAEWATISGSAGTEALRIAA